MAKFENFVCQYVHRLGHKMMQQDRVLLDTDRFRHSLPNPFPKDTRDIFDLILQIILLLLDEAKEPEENGNHNDTTRFPKLRNQSKIWAEQLVAGDILSLSAETLATAIESTVNSYQIKSPKTIATAREGIRVSCHRSLGEMAMSWMMWNAAVRENLDQHANTERLSSLSDYLDAWTQISKGLRDIK